MVHDPGCCGILACMRRVTQHPEILVQAWRGATVESVHRVCAALADPDGHVVERWGDPGLVTYWRSAAKPLQAQTWLADGSLAAQGWGDEALAVISASHAGADVHVALVRRLLADLGLTEDDLRCDAALKARHNCSGNHTGFLAACVHHGWDVATYQEPGHPAQLAALTMFGAVCGLPVDQIGTGTDGCGIVTYATPVTTMASVYALLPELLPEISAAMRAYPVLVEGDGEMDTVIMQAFGGCTSKCGAEGLSCVSLPDGRGLAVKVLDGGQRAVVPAAIELLARLLRDGAVPALARPLARPPVLNDTGDAVGELLAVFPG